MMNSNRVKVLLVLTLVLGWTASASAVTFGFFGNMADGTPQGAVTATGNTFVALPDLSPGSLGGIDVLWLLNGENGGYGAIAAAVADIAAFVEGGGVLSFHDRTVNQNGQVASTILPGGGGINFVNNFSTNIDTFPGNPIVNGPFGTITDSTLDGGNWSNHGFATLRSLPLGAVPIFFDADGIVDFYYPFGMGWVYYSTIPMDWYFGNAGAADPPRTQFVNIYARNEAAFQGGLAHGVPEPGSLTLLGGALLALGLLSRRRN